MKEQENKKQPFSDNTAEIELEIDKEFEKLYGLAYSHDDEKEDVGKENLEYTSAASVPQLEEDVKIFDSSEALFESVEDESDEYSIENISFDTEEEVKKNTKKGPKKQKKPMSARKKKVLKVLLSLFLVGVITVCVTIGGILIYLFNFMDNSIPADLDMLKLDLTSVVLVKDDDGQWVEHQRVHGVENRIWVSLDKIPDQLELAFIAIEDERFYSHAGVDWKRTFAAFGNEIFGYYGSRQGGSTITQQLVKNLTGDDDQDATRKIREMLRALELEEVYSKDTILECYLNTIPLGGSCYGVEVASEYYFGKKVGELTLAENAMIASITKSPNKLRPDRYFDDCWTRAKNVLAKMLELGFITQEEFDAAHAQEVVVVADKNAIKESEINSYFVDTMLTEVARDLAAKYGYSESEAIEMIYTNGYKIYSTLKPEVQEILEAHTADDKWFEVNAKEDGTLPEIGFCIMDYKGHIVATVGGRGEKDGNRLLDRANSIYRQPGSAMKPIGVYALAVQNNLIDYSTVIVDEPVTEIDGQKWPKNFYEDYYGRETVAYALAISINTIPCKLLQEIGLDASFDFVTNTLGLSHLNPGYDYDHSLSALAIGGTNGGTTPTEMAAAYAIFGNGGRYYEPKTYYKVTDADGNVLLEVKQNVYEQALDSDSAEVMNQLLQFVVTSPAGTGYMYNNICANKTPMFAKTGTSTEYVDNWVAAGSPYYVGAMWYGYDEPSSCDGTQIQKFLFASIFKEIHKELPFKDFPVSGEVVKEKYCDSTGLLAGESCEKTYDGWFKKDRVPEVCDGVHPPKKPIVEEETEGDEISSDLSSTEGGATETPETPDTETSSTNSEVTE